VRVSKEVRDWKLMWTMRQAFATAFTGVSINAFPPVSCASDQVVALLGKGLQVMADGEVAQS